MGAIDFTVFAAAMNKVIRPAMQAQIYAKAPMWQLIGGWSAEEQVAQRANVLVNEFKNDKMYMPMRLSDSSGYAAIGVNGTYNYGNPEIAESYSTIKTLVQSFTIPKQVLNIKTEGAIVKPIKMYSDSASRSLAMNANRQSYGDGSGTVATTNATQGGGGSQTVVLAPSTNGDIDYARYLPKGSRIKIASNAVVEVTGQTGPNTITIASAQTWSAGDAIKLVDGDGNVVVELDGFKSMIKSSGSYQNYDPATHYSWASSVDATSETLYTGTIQKKMQTQYFASNKVGEVKWIIMNSSAFQCYGNSLTGSVRQQPKDVLTGGWKGLDFMGGNAQILLDYDCPDDTILFLTDADLVFGEYQGMEFEKGTDGNLLKIAGKLTYEVTLSWMGNIGTVSRASQAALRGKTFSQLAAAP